MKITIQLKHGSKKFPLDIDDASTLSDLMEEAAQLTGVPKSGQKMILNGRTLTSLDHVKCLSECKVTNFCKIMVLGKKYDPEGDEVASRIKDLESKSFEIDRKLEEVSKDWKEIENGFLAQEHHQVALKSLKKTCKTCQEEYMKVLENLDSLHLEEHQLDAKIKRKSLVNKINASLDSADRICVMIEEKAP